VSTLPGAVLTRAGWRRGPLRLDTAGRIAAIEGVAIDEAAARQGPCLLPGFIDLHVHGGGGADTMDGGNAVATLARSHAQHGSTALLATTMTAPRGEIEAALAALAPLVKQRPPGTARVLGVHLEGPYINRERLGAQPDFASAATLAEVQALHAVAPIRLITLAPEVPGHLALIGALVEAGFVVQLGHSAASYEEGRAALAAGARGVTHLFNAMSGLHHRKPGMVGAALAHAEHAELIPDLLHVHEGALRVALRCIPGCHAVTDATAAACMPDGEYKLGRQRVFHCLGAVRLADGTLAGSALTMDRALLNLLSLGLSLAEASQRTASHAASLLGLPDRGRLAPGAWADVVQVDGASGALQRVWVEGEPVRA
jgi:N-acetylglucosamine-6-phosphate deacetylase